MLPRAAWCCTAPSSSSTLLCQKHVFLGLSPRHCRHMGATLTAQSLGKPRVRHISLEGSCWAGICLLCTAQQKYKFPRGRCRQQ